MATAKKSIAAKAPVAPPAKPAAKKVVKPAAPVVMKPTTAEAATKPKAPVKPKTAPAAKSVGLSPEQRNHYVQVAAFYIAERRGFTAGDPAADWLAAEEEVSRLVASGHFNNA